MGNIYKSTSRIENFLNMLLTKAKISDNLFIGNLPAVINKTWDDMVLIDVLKSTDYDAYADGQANIFLYAKSKDNLSLKPVQALYKMELALDEAIENCQNEHYVIEANWRDNGYSSTTKYYYNVVNITITVR